MARCGRCGLWSKEDRSLVMLTMFIMSFAGYMTHRSSLLETFYMLLGGALFGGMMLAIWWIKGGE